MLGHKGVSQRIRLPKKLHGKVAPSPQTRINKAVVSKVLVSQAQPHQIEQKTQLFFKLD